jgi:hypothetical protein
MRFSSLYVCYISYQWFHLSTNIWHEEFILLIPFVIYAYSLLWSVCLHYLLQHSRFALPMKWSCLSQWMKGQIFLFYSLNAMGKCLLLVLNDNVIQASVCVCVCGWQFTWPTNFSLCSDSHKACCFHRVVSLPMHKVVQNLNSSAGVLIIWISSLTWSLHSHSLTWWLRKIPASITCRITANCWRNYLQSEVTYLYYERNLNSENNCFRYV